MSRFEYLSNIRAIQMGVMHEIELGPKNGENPMSRAEYLSHLHAMQTGVMYEIELDPKNAGTDPKHLRVGVNASMSDHAGLVELLIRKGVFTSEEYVDAVAESMKHEKERYEEIVRRLLNNENIHLG